MKARQGGPPTNQRLLGIEALTIVMLGACAMPIAAQLDTGAVLEPVTTSTTGTLENTTSTLDSALPSTGDAQSTDDSTLDPVSSTSASTDSDTSTSTSSADSTSTSGESTTTTSTSLPAYSGKFYTKTPGTPTTTPTLGATGSGSSKMSASDSAGSDGQAEASTSDDTGLKPGAPQGPAVVPGFSAVWVPLGLVAAVDLLRRRHR